jgi:hypothetical protein
MIGGNIRAQLAEKSAKRIVRVLLGQVFEQLERAHPTGIMIAQINLEIFRRLVLHVFDSQPWP